MNIVNNKKNIMTIIGVITLIIVVSALSYTYAYFAFSSSNSNTISGDAGVPKLELTIEKIIPTTASSNLKLVPLLDEAVSTAVVGTGGQSSCIDANGNLSCQIYKITVQNTGTINLVVKGTIELLASGSNNIFENLKWQQLENETTIKSGAIVNSMATSTLVDSVSINVNATKIYYFVLWISEINENQSGNDYGDFKGIVTFNDTTGKGVTATFTS